MINHFSLGVKDYEKSCRFYKETLSILFGQDLLINEYVYPPFVQDEVVLFSGAKFTSYVNKESNRAMAIVDSTYGILEDPLRDSDCGSPRGSHYAFSSPSKEAVDAWYHKAIEMGGSCNGAPGPRESYGPSYYGAFVVDPAGYRLECCLSSYRNLL